VVPASKNFLVKQSIAFGNSLLRKF